MLFGSPVNRPFVLERRGLASKLKVLFFSFIFFHMCVIICHWAFESLLADMVQMQRYDNEYIFQVLLPQVLARHAESIHKPSYS